MVPGRAYEVPVINEDELPPRGRLPPLENQLRMPHRFGKIPSAKSLGVSQMRPVRQSAVNHKDSCFICLELLTKYPCVQYPCGKHTGHKKCVALWFKQKQEFACPMRCPVVKK